MIPTEEELAVLEAIVTQSGPKRPRSVNPTAGCVEHIVMPRAVAEGLFSPDLIAHMIAPPCSLLALWPLETPLLTLTPYAATLVSARLVTRTVGGVEAVPDSEKDEDEDQAGHRDVMVDVTFWDRHGLEVRPRMPRHRKFFASAALDLQPSPHRGTECWFEHDIPRKLTRRERRAVERAKRLLGGG